MNFQQNNAASFAIQMSNSPVVKAFMAGSFSGTCSTLLFQPLDLVKTRIQQVDTRRSITKVVNDVIVKESLFGLWRGLAPSLARTVPGVGLYFSCMHTLKTTLCEGKPSPKQSLVIGALARGIAGAIMIPMTVVKIRCESGNYKYNNVITALSNIRSTEGLRGLTSGLLPTLTRDVPFSGLYLMFYDKLKMQLTGTSQHPEWEKFGCGLLAGVLASTVTQPADVVKTKLQLVHGSTLVSVVKTIAQRDGLTGFFRGSVPRMTRRTLMAALAWGVYEQMMKSLNVK